MNATGKGGLGERKHQINRKGRPKSFNALRELAQQIAHETMVDQTGTARTVAELIMRKWATSSDPQLQMRYVEIAFGKVPTPVEMKGDITANVTTQSADKIVKVLADAEANAARIAAEAATAWSPDSLPDED